MRLRKAQKEALLAWISEGLQTDEINSRAAQFKPPFEVTRSQVKFYRDSRQVDLLAIQAAAEGDALTTGYALREFRVQRLQALAMLMERDLFGGFLWVDDVKAVGTGPAQKMVTFEEFNTAEVQHYRGVLDDIAKETGGRRQEINLGGKIGIGLTADELAKMERAADAELSSFNSSLEAPE